MYDQNWPVGQGGEPSGAPARIGDVTPALLAALALAAVAPGPWTGSTSTSHGTRARVTFDVLAGSGAIQPFVRVDLHGCRSTRTVHIRSSLGLVAASSRGRFSVRTRFSPPGRASKVRLRFAGRFLSETSARGSLRGRLRYAGGHVCRIPRLSWTARPVAPPPVTPADDPALDDDDAVVDGEPIEDGDYDEDEGPIEDDPGDDGGADPGDEP
jgi:hypothetical protein